MDVLSCDAPSLIVGTYADAGGEGLYPLRHERGEWTFGEPYRGAPNASFGAWSSSHGLHYLVDEASQGSIGAFTREGDSWRQLARLSTAGAEPCYAALSEDERWLAVANYGSGSLALFRLDPESGRPEGPVSVRHNEGRGPNAERQEGPHAHCSIFSPDGKWLYQTDLGTDEVRAFAFDPEHGLRGEGRTAYDAPAGSGPRHLVFHPREPLAFLVSELASTLTVLDVGDGELTSRQMLSTRPKGFDGHNLGGHLALNSAGDRVYVTNRGHDCITVYALEDGVLAPLGRTPAGGSSPRFFLLLEEQRAMFVANEEGNSVTVFDVRKDGTLAQTGAVAVKGPAFIFATGLTE